MSEAQHAVSRVFIRAREAALNMRVETGLSWAVTDENRGARRDAWKDPIHDVCYPWTGAPLNTTLTP